MYLICMIIDYLNCSYRFHCSDQYTMYYFNCINKLLCLLKSGFVLLLITSKVKQTITLYSLEVLNNKYINLRSYNYTKCIINS